MNKSSPKFYKPIIFSLALVLISTPLVSQAANRGKSKIPTQSKEVVLAKERLVLMPLRLADEDKNLQGAMETALTEGLQQKYEVFSGEQVAQKAHDIFMKESRNVAHKECDETKCMQNIAMAFQSELIAIANVTKQDGGYFLALSIRNLFDNKDVYSKSLPCRGCDSFQAVEKLKELSGYVAPTTSPEFRPPISEARSVTSVVASDAETELWNEVKNLNQIDNYQLYVSQYPNGRYVAIARILIKKLQDEAAALVARRDQLAWQAADQGRDEISYQKYLREFPQGKFVDLAQAKIQKLQADKLAREEQISWQKTKSTDTLEAYQDFIDRYPNGSYISTAKLKVAAMQAALKELELWKRSQRADTPESYQDYLNQYPNGKNVDAAKQRITDIRRIQAEAAEASFWQNTQYTDNLQSYKNYLEKYPNGIHVQAAKQRISDLLAAYEQQDAWDKVRAIDTIPAYQNFLSKYQTGLYVIAAQEKIAAIRKAQIEKADEALWQKTESVASIEAYQEYLKQFPSGKHASVAQDKIVAMRKLIAEKEEAAFWQKTETANSLQSYQDYWDKYPSGAHVLLAQERIAAIRKLLAKQAEEAFWQKSQTVSSIPSYQEYLAAYQSGAHVVDAKNRIAALQAAIEEQALWQKTQAADTIPVYHAYLDKYSKGSHVAAAQERIAAIRKQQAEQAEEALWQKTQTVDTLPAYMEYLDKYATEKHSVIAQERIAAIRKALAEQAEEVFWQKTLAEDSIKEYQKYLGKYPAGKYLLEAQAKLAAIIKKTDEMEEDTLWKATMSKDTVVAYKFYISKYPNGKYLEIAQGKIGNNLKTIKDCPSCPEMVVIPAGSFEMGTMESEHGNSENERPAHNVSIGRSFAIGKTEVTQGQWMAVMGRNPSKFSSCGENCPVEQVNWADVHEYIQKLNKITGKLYRLPSEAEWEYSCRGGGESLDYCGSINLDEVAWYGYEISEKTTHPVATKQANSFGLYDMSGNVWELVEDGYHESYKGAPADGSTWIAEGQSRVRRGGSWSNISLSERVSKRGRVGAMVREGDTGFRLVRTLP